MAESKSIIEAATIILPLVSAFAKQAEGSDLSGTEKHEAVATATEAAYKALQRSGSVKEIKDIDWALVAPLVIPVGQGLISIVVALFKRVGLFFSKKRQDGEAAK